MLIIVILVLRSSWQSPAATAHAAGHASAHGRLINLEIIAQLGDDEDPELIKLLSAQARN